MRKAVSRLTLQNSASVAGLLLWTLAARQAAADGAVQMLSGEALRGEGALRIEEILGAVAGVTRQSDRDGSSVFVMRGVTDGRGGAMLTIDGITQDRPDSLAGGAIDLDRVDIVRGAQLTSAGGGATTGALRLVTRAPVLGRLLVDGRVESGSFDLRNTTGIVNLPIAATQALRLAFSDSRRRGFVSSGSGAIDQQYLRLRYRWEPRDDVAMTLSASLQRSDANSVNEGDLLYTGHFVPFTGRDAVYSPGTGLYYLPDVIMQQRPVSYSFAAGSVLGPGRAPLASATTLGFVPLCTPVGLPAFLPPFTSGKVPNAPFVAVRGCPVSSIAVRDNINVLERRDPWDDGATPASWGNRPVRRTEVRSFNGEIRIGMRAGELTLLPGMTRATEHRVGAGLPASASDQTQDSWQFEARLSSPDDARIRWLAGIYWHDTTGLTGLEGSVSVPNQSPPALGAGQTSTDGANPATGVRSLLGNCYIFAADYCSQLSGSTQANSVTDSAVYGGLTFPVAAKFRAQASLRYQRQRRHVDFTEAEAAGNVITASSPLGLGGYVFSSPVAGSNCATATGAASCLVQFVPATLSQLGSSVYTQTRSTLSYRIGAEYDIGERHQVYTAFDSASRPALRRFSLGLRSGWFDGRLHASAEFFDTTIRNAPAAPLIDLNYAITPAGGTNFNCPVLAGVQATARLGPLRTNADTCFNDPVTEAITANEAVRGIDFGVSYRPTPADSIELAVEWLQKAEVSQVAGLADITAADVFAAAAANIANPSVGSAHDLQITADAIAAGFNAQNSALRFGGYLPQSPRLSIDASYAHAFRLRGGSRITPRVNMVYKSAYWISGGGPLGTAAAIVNASQAIDSGGFWPNVQPSYRLWNLFLGWRSATGAWGIDGYVTNVGNVATLILPGAQTTTTSVVGNVAVTGGTVVLGAPRELGLALNARF